MGQTINLSELTGKYVGKQFNEFSCMKLMHDFCHDIGFDMPGDFDGLTLDNYMEFWERDKKEAIKKLFLFFMTLGENVFDFSKIKRFDLLIMEETNGDKKNMYPALYMGGNICMTSNINSGVKMFHIGAIHKVVLARRIY